MSATRTSLRLPLAGTVELPGGNVYDIRAYCKVASPGQGAVAGGSLNAVAYE